MVISGKDKGKKGRVMKTLIKANRIVIEKVNLRTKHIKKSNGRAGEKIQYEAPISSSNVVVVCPSCSKPTRVGYKIMGNGKKERICKKCQQSLGISTSDAPAKTKKSVKKIKAT